MMSSTENNVPSFGADIRKEFMLRENSVFLNHGSYGSMPRCVHERQVRYLAELESHPDTWFRYNMYTYLRNSKDKAADFMGIDSEDTFFLQNVTKAINTVMKTFPLRFGDAYLITSLTYGAVKVTSHSTVARVEGAKIYEMDIKFPITGDDSVVEMYEDFLVKHSDVKLAVIDHITSPTSVLLPVKRIVEVCHRHGVVVVVDAAHVPGQLKVDIQDIDADFYTGNLHKWVFCPRSCAFIWMNPKRHHAWFKPLVTSAYDNDALHDAFAYEGTKDDTPYICSADGIDFYNRIGGMEKIVQYNSTLLSKGVSYLEEKWGTKCLEIPECMEAPCLRIIHLPFVPGFSDCLGQAATDVFKGKKNLELQKLILDRFDVQIAVVIVEGKLMARVAAQVYNTMEDFIKLGEAVLALTKQRTNEHLMMSSAENNVPAFGADIRMEFMLRENSVFLNHGAYGGKPRCVHERQVRYLEELESHPDTWFRYNMYTYLRNSKAKVAEFMGIDTEDTFLIQNVTKAINTVMKTFPLGCDDAFLISSLTHPAVKMTASVTVARVQGAKLYKMDVKFPITDGDSIVEKYDDFLSKHPDIKLAALEHISSPTAVVLPVKRIVEVCHKHGVVVVVDAAHVPGQLKVDIQDIDADFYTGNLHKWVFCPRACAFIWMNPQRQHSWFKPLVTAAFDNDSLHVAFAFEGTKDDTPFICSADAIDFYNRIGGMEKVVQYNSALLTKGIAYLEEKWGTKRLAIPECMTAPCLRVIHLPFIPGFTDCLGQEATEMFSKKKSLELQKLILDRFDIQIAVLALEGKLMARVAAQVYNTMEDFIKLGEAVLGLSERKKDEF
ncbi:uncharacterized protein LOC123564270 [Mercenaria mercenaria]|uniref:uncharacterized protein LOC123564270 n=1 Tax=Mercenaria mercenaria TaxID=6596 RepID=UPI001E1D8DD3|nr:uncharacterized protein LOC123564270 [Mercenaria mercenaria]